MGNATQLLAILREGWSAGQRDRMRGIRAAAAPIECDPATRERIKAESVRRYGMNDTAAHDAYSDGYMCGLTDDAYALSIAKDGITGASSEEDARAKIDSLTEEQ